MAAEPNFAESDQPIKVGTDGAMALGMVNSLINEHGIYDAEYLMYKTNGPYLIRPSDGRYMRDSVTGKPLETCFARAVGLEPTSKTDLGIKSRRLRISNRRNMKVFRGFDKSDQR